MLCAGWDLRLYYSSLVTLPKCNAAETVIEMRSDRNVCHHVVGHTRYRYNHDKTDLIHVVCQISVHIHTI